MIKLKNHPTIKMEIESNVLKGFKHHILNLEKMVPVQMQKCSLHKREKYG
jgi:hypothetical protein